MAQQSRIRTYEDALLTSAKVLHAVEGEKYEWKASGRHGRGQCSHVASHDQHDVASTNPQTTIRRHTRQVRHGDVFIRIQDVAQIGGDVATPGGMA